MTTFKIKYRSFFSPVPQDNTIIPYFVTEESIDFTSRIISTKNIITCTYFGFGFGFQYTHTINFKYTLYIMQIYRLELPPPTYCIHIFLSSLPIFIDQILWIGWQKKLTMNMVILPLA